MSAPDEARRDTHQVENRKRNTTMNSEKYHLSIDTLNQSYGQSHTLWDVNLKVPAGECTVLMGRNGVGKTTLLKSIMGLVSSESQGMHYLDVNISRLATEQRAQLGMGYVPQGRQIFPLLTVEENLLTGLAARRPTQKTNETPNDKISNSRNGLKRIRNQRLRFHPDEIPSLIFDLFPILHNMRRRRGGDLSGGQQQQLAIARALVASPKLLILDEPTEGIQPNIVADIARIVRKLREELELTVLLVEQKLTFAQSVGDHYLIMDRGRNVASGAMDTLDQSLIESYLTV